MAGVDDVNEVSRIDLVQLRESTNPVPYATTYVKREISPQPLRNITASPAAWMEEAYSVIEHP
jgi:hypothetical protein